MQALQALRVLVRMSDALIKRIALNDLMRVIVAR